MKKIIIYISLLFAPVFIYNSYAQTNSIEDVEHSIKEKGKYGLLVRNVKHLKASIMTGGDLKKQFPDIDYQIVVCGELIKDVANDDNVQNMLKKAKLNGIKVLICGLSVKQLNVPKESFPDSVEFTENGLIYIFGLQEKGYKTITL